ncbi:MAG: histidine kinase [Bacteroidales bacterium]|nr:histidine kinase [Bacteroidales bacterium]
MEKNLEYFRKSGNKLGVYTSLLQIANACFYTRRPEGLEYAHEAQALAEEFGDDWMIANALHKVVNYNKNVFKYPEYRTNLKLAEADLQRAREILVKSELPYRHRLLSETYREIGELRWGAGDTNTAIHYTSLGIATVDTFLRSMDTITFPETESKYGWYTSDHVNMAYSYTALSTINAVKGNYKAALENQLKRDSLYNLEMTAFSEKQFIIMQVTYEDEKKRNRIYQLRREEEIHQARQSHTILLVLLIGGAILITLLAVLFFIQRRRFQSEQKTMELEQKLLRSQMNPHFLFNALTGIQNFILTQKPDQASIYLSKFANLVRNILDNSVEEFVTLEKEISTIENYLELQKVRYAGKFDYRITVTDAIDPEEMMIPPMLAQPFIENSIEHGIKHRETPGHLDIRFSLQDHTLIFEVEDDGVGRQKAREISIQSESAHRSMATSLTRDRLVILNRKHHKKIILEITDLKNAQGEAGGTSVKFGIPVNL